jgi:hypothetical protein
MSDEVVRYESASLSWDHVRKSGAEMRAGMDSVFELHHLAHAHNAEVGDDSLGGRTAKSMAEGGR